MKFQLVVAVEDASLILTPENEAEQAMLGVVTPVGVEHQAQVKIAYNGHHSYKRVNQMVVSNFKAIKEFE